MYNCFWICFIFKWYGRAMYHLIMCKFISVVCTLKHDTIWRRTPRFGYELNKKYTQKWFEILFGIDSSNFIFYPFGPGPPPPYPYNIRIEITVDILRRSLTDHRSSMAPFVIRLFAALHRGKFTSKIGTVHSLFSTCKIENNMYQAQFLNKYHN